MNKYFKIWYTGPVIDWILDRIVCAKGEQAAVDYITENYRWAQIIDLQEVRHAQGDDADEVNPVELAVN